LIYDLICSLSFYSRIIKFFVEYGDVFQKIEQNVMKIKQDFNENIRLTEENLRLSQELQQLKKTNIALNEQLK
jgi:hypothetical protein